MTFMQQNDVYCIIIGKSGRLSSIENVSTGWFETAKPTRCMVPSGKWLEFGLALAPVT